MVSKSMEGGAKGVKKAERSIIFVGLLMTAIGLILTGINWWKLAGYEKQYEIKTGEALKNWNQDHVVLTLQIEKRLFETCKWNQGKVMVTFDGRKL